MQNKDRMKSILNKTLIGLFCAGVLCSAEVERIARPMGWRAAPPTEQIALKKERARQAAAHANQLNSRSQSFSTTHDGAYHTPFVISHNGENIELEDGSIWVINADDRSKTKTWITADLLIIMPNSSWFSSEDYKLINLSTGEGGKANLIVPPAFNGLYTYWITAIDTVERKIRLNDGSSWKMTKWMNRSSTAGSSMTQ